MDEREAEALRAAIRIIGEWSGSFVEMLLEVARVVEPVTEGYLRLLKQCEEPRPQYRPPTRPRPAQWWELRPQLASAAPMTSWQRCPERHRHRESRQRWQRERCA